MLLDLRHDAAARALSLWMAGLALWMVSMAADGGLRWYLFTDDSYDSHDLIQVVSICLSILRMAVAVVLGWSAWRYASAAGFTALKVAAVPFLIDPLLDAAYLTLSLTRDPLDFESQQSIYEILGHVWMVLALLRVVAFVVFFSTMARVSQTLGHTLLREKVFFAIGAVAFWGLVLATFRLDLIELPGLARYFFDLGVLVLVCVGGLLLMRDHRAHLRMGAPDEPAATGDVTGLGPAGQGLGRYHAAIISQIGFTILGNLLVLGAVKGGAPEAARGLMVVVLVIGLFIQLVAVSGLAAFARRLPVLHASKGPAGAAVIAQVLNAVLGFVATALVIRAFESGRLSLLFDLQDQLPVIEGIGTVLGCIAAAAVLTAIENTGAMGEFDSAGGLKVAIAVLGVSVMAFKLLDPRDLGGPATLGFALLLMVGAITVAIAFLRRVRKAADAMQMAD